MPFKLVIKNYDDPTYEHVIGERPTAAELDRMERLVGGVVDAVNINLNHDKYYTEIVEVDDDE